MKNERNLEIHDLYCILVETDDGEGLVFASSNDPEHQAFPHMPMLTHSTRDLDGMLEIAERIARKSGARLVLYKYTGRQKVKTITGTVQH